MLDSDAFLEPGESIGGSSAGSGSPKGGRSGTNKGGSANAGTQNMPMPTAGSGNTPVPGSLQQICQSYCQGYATKCPQELDPGQDCQATCMNEVGTTEGGCQKSGIAALRCLTPFFANATLSCNQAIGNGLTKCGMQVNAFKQCSGQTDPEPTPNPGPNPNPGPACMSGGEAGPGYCKMQYFCPSAQYTVSCSYSNGTSTHECVCFLPNNSVQSFSLSGSVGNPCGVAAMSCGVPGPV